MKLSTAIKNLKNDKEIDNFLKDLCTPAEIEAMKERWEVAQLLYKGESTYRDIAAKLNTSTATVTRVARFLFKETNKGYMAILTKDNDE
jgi:TrpR-related protein YerC/YecD